MEQKTIKIQVLNDTKLCVLPVLPDLKTVVPVESISGLEAAWEIKGHETGRFTIQIENGYIVLPISATMPLGVYSVHMTGKINGQDWSDNRYEMFELVKYGEGIRYDRYYTKTVILGLPDDTLHQIISEYEAKRDEYQRMIDELNRGEVATKADLGLEPGETVAGLIKAGGGGGNDMQNAILSKMHPICNKDLGISGGQLEAYLNDVKETFLYDFAGVVDWDLYIVKWICPYLENSPQLGLYSTVYTSPDAPLFVYATPDIEAAHIGNVIRYIDDQLAKKKDIEDIKVLQETIAMGRVSACVISDFAYVYAGTKKLTYEGSPLYFCKLVLADTPEARRAEIPEEYKVLYAQDIAKERQVYEEVNGAAVAMEGVMIDNVANDINGKLDQILAAVKLTTAQADADWKNVKPA